MNDRFAITPETKVATLLEHFPELEELLIGLAPPFKKLRNPVLRKSVAKVASLHQAAAVGRVPLEQMINLLREKVGQAPIELEKDDAESLYYSTQPSWFDQNRVAVSIVESEIDPDVMPLTPLMQTARGLDEGEIVELVTTYLPAPGIDIMRKKGFLVWSTEEDSVIKTYFTKPSMRLFQSDFQNPQVISGEARWLIVVGKLQRREYLWRYI